MHLPSTHTLVSSVRSHLSPSQTVSTIGLSSHSVHTNAEHGRTTLFSTPKLISAKALQKAISMPSPSINLASNSLFVPAGTKTVVCVEPSSETGIISIIGGEMPSPVISSMITAPLKFGCSTLDIDSCSLDNSVDEPEKNSSGSSIKRLIDAFWLSPPVPPQESK